MTPTPQNDPCPRHRLWPGEKEERRKKAESDTVIPASPPVECPAENLCCTPDNTSWTPSNGGEASPLPSSIEGIPARRFWDPDIVRDLLSRSGLVYGAVLTLAAKGKWEGWPTVLGLSLLVLAWSCSLRASARQARRFHPQSTNHESGFPDWLILPSMYALLFVAIAIGGLLVEYLVLDIYGLDPFTPDASPAPASLQPQSPAR